MWAGKTAFQDHEGTDSCVIIFIQFLPLKQDRTTTYNVTVACRKMEQISVYIL